MGGNAGTQTLTIVVRGLSLGELDKENARKVLLKEIGLGILNGVIIGALVSVGAWFFAGNPWFGVVAGLAMICNMIVATLAGYFVPVILDRFHVDPALPVGFCNNMYRYVWLLCVFRTCNHFNVTFTLINIGKKANVFLYKLIFFHGFINTIFSNIITYFISNCF